jgi:hypothetical protein
MPEWLTAGSWGLLAGSALLVGAALGYYVRVPQRLIAGVIAVGSGVLISALSFDVMDQAYRHGGFGSAAAWSAGTDVPANRSPTRHPACRASFERQEDGGAVAVHQ